MRRFVCIVTILIAMLATAFQTQAQSPCDNTPSTLSGKYVVDGIGNISAVLGLLNVPLLTDGYMIFSIDAGGNPVVTAKLIESLNRAPDTISTYNGSYQLNSDCSYTVNLISTSSNATRIFSIRADEIGLSTTNVADSGVVLDTDVGYVEKLSLQRSLDPANGCTNANFSGEFDGESDEDDTPGFAGIYKVLYNADGTFNLTETDSNGGSDVAVTNTGTFSVASDCTVTLVDAQQLTSYIVLVFSPSAKAAAVKTSSRGNQLQDFDADDYSYHPEHDGHHHKAHRHNYF